VTFLTADMAEMSTWIRGVERAGARFVTITDDDPLRLYRTFVTVISLTRSIAERWRRGQKFRLRVRAVRIRP